ncbi:hypothetical protein ACKKBF_B33025 [Auxenochlorella protothecoides x Auxenochlorella symbiontica]
MAFTIFGTFLYLLLASAALGIVLGLVTALCLRRVTFHETSQEVAYIGLMAYLSYLVGEVAGLSGIVALFVSAIIISHYALHNISKQSRTTTVHAFATLSYVSEGIIFIICGMDAVDPVKWRATNVRHLLWMFWIVILLLMASRAAFVGPVAALHNAFSAVRLSLRECVVIWWAGLMRGAVSVALVYTLLGGGGREGDATLITTTLVVVIISILGFGAATKPLLAFLMRDHVEQPSSPLTSGLAVEMAGAAGSKGGGAPPESSALLRWGSRGEPVAEPPVGEAAEPSRTYRPEGEDQSLRKSGSQTSDAGSALPAAWGNLTWGPPEYSPESEVLLHEPAHIARLPGDLEAPPSPLPGSLAQTGRSTALGAAFQLDVAHGAQPSVPGRAGSTWDERGSAHGSAAVPSGTGKKVPQPGHPSPAKASSGPLGMRVNRWWKEFDEGTMQPRFGGPLHQR